MSGTGVRLQWELIAKNQVFFIQHDDSFWTIALEIPMRRKKIFKYYQNHRFSLIGFHTIEPCYSQFMRSAGRIMANFCGFCRDWLTQWLSIWFGCCHQLIAAKVSRGKRDPYFYLRQPHGARNRGLRVSEHYLARWNCNRNFWWIAWDRNTTPRSNLNSFCLGSWEHSRSVLTVMPRRSGLPAQKRCRFGIYPAGRLIHTAIAMVAPCGFLVKWSACKAQQFPADLPGSLFACSV